MNKRIKELWIEALRSGDYKQGKGLLRNENDEFCCLGVLTNLYALEHPEIAKQETDPTRFLKCSGYLPIEVAEWAEISTMFAKEQFSKNGIVIGYDVEIGDQSAIHWNDTYCLTFSKIADKIETHL